MIHDVEVSRRTWNAVIKLAIVISIVAVTVTLVVSAAGDVPQAAIVLPIIVVAFTASWIATGRVRRDAATMPVRSTPT